MKSIYPYLIVGILVSCGTSNNSEPQIVLNETVVSDDQFEIIQPHLPRDSSYFLRSFDLNEEPGYLNYLGDTVIQFGKYTACFTDTFRTFAKVLLPKDGLYAIDKNENKLFEIYWFENGPDYTIDGLYRIKKEGKIGYANDNFEIVIEPQFECAFPFEKGKAKVTYDCELIDEGEHQLMSSNAWLFIDKQGNKLQE